ncbi:MAG: NAD(P)H-dependent oxidoreductase subunit E [bacterium]|nr:NAD(P)H-dependent oxidoreductase subunit E [bacterium]
MSGNLNQGTSSTHHGQPLDVTAQLLIDDYIERFGDGRGLLIPILYRLQDYLGFIAPEVEEYVAKRLGLKSIEVRGVVSFYSYFTDAPRGKHHLEMCLGTACYVCGGRRLLETIQEEAGIDVGETSADGLFSLQVVRCIGACGLASAVAMNGQVFGRLSPIAARSLIRRLRSGDEMAGQSKPGGGHA